jgi:hypothetical protein
VFVFDGVFVAWTQVRPNRKEAPFVAAFARRIGTEANTKSENVFGHQRQRGQGADLTESIATLILKYLLMKSSFGWSLSNLAVLLRQQLFMLETCGLN